MNQDAPPFHDYSYTDPRSGHHHSWIAQPVLDLISAVVPNHNLPKGKSNLRILDLGCGNGSFTNFLANQGFEAVGIEESASGIEIARQTYPNCRFIRGSIYNLELTELENAFDIVVSTEVIEHLFLPRELPRVVQKLLKPNGHLILTTPYHGYLKNLALSLSGKMDSHFTALWDGGHIKFFSVKTLNQLLTSEGFTNPSFKFAGRIPYLWKSMICISKLAN